MIKISGVVFFRVIGEGYDFRGVCLTGARFAGRDFSGSYFSGCVLKSAHFLGCDMRGCKFVRCNLNGADFSGSNLRKVDFTGSAMCGVTLRGADIKGATFNRTDLAGARYTNEEQRQHIQKRRNVGAVAARGNMLALYEIWQSADPGTRREPYAKEILSLIGRCPILAESLDAADLRTIRREGDSCGPAESTAEQIQSERLKARARAKSPRPWRT